MNIEHKTIRINKNELYVTFEGEPIFKNVWRKVARTIKSKVYMRYAADVLIDGEPCILEIGESLKKAFASAWKGEGTYKGVRTGSGRNTVYTVTFERDL